MGSSWPAALRGSVCGNRPACLLPPSGPTPGQNPPSWAGAGGSPGPRPGDGSVSGGLSGTVCDLAHPSGALPCGAGGSQAPGASK